MLRSPVFVLARAGAWRAMGGGRLTRTWSAANPPGFRPGARWRSWRARGPRRAPGVLACAAEVLACVGGPVRAGGLWRAGGSGFPWRLTRSRLCLGWCCGLRVVAGLPVCGAVRGGECHVLFRSYVVGVHWVRTYACVALGEWRTDAASEEVYVGAGGGIASVA